MWINYQLNILNLINNYMKKIIKISYQNAYKHLFNKTIYIL